MYQYRYYGEAASAHLLGLLLLAVVGCDRPVTPTPVAHTLSVVVSGQGSVSSSPGGIACPTTCAAPFAHGSSVTLFATPANGFQVAWAGCDGAAGNSCAVGMQAARTVGASFSPIIPTFRLTVGKLGDGAGTVTSSPPGISCGADCAEDYKPDTAVTLTATPAATSTFAGWEGACAGSQPTCLVSMSASRTVQVQFNQNPPQNTCLSKSSPTLYDPQPPNALPEAAPPLGNGSVTFDGTPSDSMFLRTSRYEIRLSKINGSILQLRDVAANRLLSLGSKGQCLWGASLYPTDGSADDTKYIGGCLFDRARRQFAYGWNPTDKTLTLSYIGPALDNQAVSATVRLRAMDEAFDLQIDLDNRTGMRLGRLYLPSDLVVEDGAVSAGYGGFGLPGIRLKGSFFSTAMDFVPLYPSSSAFTDLVAVDVGGSHIGTYTVNPPNTPVTPVNIGFFDPSRIEPGFPASQFILHRAYRIGAPSGQAYSSPSVRTWVGHPVRDVIQYQRHDNGIANFASVDAKLGPRYSRFVQSPLVKADLWQVGKAFRDWPEYFRRAAGPLLLHPVAFWRAPPGRELVGTFDENYPGFLPPDPRWGSSQDFKDMTLAAEDCQHLVMPYTNPTWWDNESQTYQTSAGVDALSITGQPIRETYGVHEGYVVSPHAPQVKQVLESLMDRWKVEIPVQCVFEDQIGARGLEYDRNAEAPAINRYSQGWLEHTRRYRDRCLMTEHGWDRLAETEAGFMGSLQWLCRSANKPDGWPGESQYDLFPLANFLFGDKVLMYQHNLNHCSLLPVEGADSGSWADKDVLRWSAAFGLMLGYRWSADSASGLDSATLDWVVALQRAVASRYAGRRMLAFEPVSNAVYRSDFGTVKVLSNWNSASSYATPEFTVAPGGFVAYTDGQMLAGIVSRLYGQALGGEHGLVVEWGGNKVLVRKPLGGDTTLRIPFPGALSQLRAFGRDGSLLGSKPFAVGAGFVTFVYSKELNSQTVGWYELN